MRKMELNPASIMELCPYYKFKVNPATEKSNIKTTDIFRGLANPFLQNQQKNAIDFDFLCAKPVFPAASGTHS